jgi:hypothetical protein
MEKDLPVFFEREAAGPENWSASFFKEKNLLGLPGIKLWIIQPIA